MTRSDKGPWGDMMRCAVVTTGGNLTKKSSDTFALGMIEAKMIPELRSALIEQILQIARVDATFAQRLRKKLPGLHGGKTGQAAPLGLDHLGPSWPSQDKRIADELDEIRERYGCTLGKAAEFYAGVLIRSKHVGLEHFKAGDETRLAEWLLSERKRFRKRANS